MKVITEHLGPDVLEDSYINKLSKDVPTLVAKRDTYFKVAQFLKYNELLGFDYLSELHGTDFETHMEVYVHLYSYKNRQSVALKVKIDRSEPTIESLQPLWAGAEWPECEAYDLLGIKFQDIQTYGASCLAKNGLAIHCEKITSRTTWRCNQ